MAKTTFKMLSKNEQKHVIGGKLAGGSEGTIVGWRYYNGVYYVDIQYPGGETSCDVPWGPAEPQIGDIAG